MEIISYSDDKLKNNGYDFILAKKQFSNVGMACFVMCVLLIAVTTALNLIVKSTGVLLDVDSPLFWLINFAPNYLIAMPICVLILNRKPQMQPAKGQLGVARWFKFLVISFAVMTIGNFVASIVSGIVTGATGKEVNNAVAELAFSDNVLLKGLVMAIIAPIFEEYIFRKKIIDSIYAYGEKRAVLISAIIFGSIHGNISQMFYAFTLGLVFGYIYIRTAKIRYTIGIHIIINTLGGVIAPWIATMASDEIGSTFDDIANITEQQALNFLSSPGFLLLIGYAVMMLVLFIIGLVFLIKDWKLIYFKDTPLEIPGEKTYKITICNFGMILFFIICIFNIVEDIIL